MVIYNASGLSELREICTSIHQEQERGIHRQLFKGYVDWSLRKGQQSNKMYGGHEKLLHKCLHSANWTKVTHLVKRADSSLEICQAQPANGMATSQADW